MSPISLLRTALCLIGLGALVLFVNLDAPRVRSSSDESLHLRIAQEMFQSKVLFPTTLDGKPYYGKPPLRAWLSQIPLGLFGQSKASYRLVDAISGVFAVAATGVLCQLLSGSALAGLLAGVLLLSSTKLIHGTHGLRAALPDSVLLLLLTLGMLFGWYFFSLCTGDNKDSTSKRWRLALAAIALGLLSAAAAVTKNVVGLFPICFCAAILLWKSEFRKQRVCWAWLSLAGLLALAVPATLLLLAYAHDPASLQGYFFQEVADRVLIGYHNRRNPLFYLQSIAANELMPWPVWILGIGYGLLHARHCWLRTYLLLWVLAPLFAFSLIPSRLHWYLFPVLPALAILAAWAVHDIFSLRAQKHESLSWAAKGRLLALGVAALCVTASAAAYFMSNVRRSLRGATPTQLEQLFAQLQSWSSDRGAQRRILQYADVFAVPNDRQISRVGEFYRDLSWPQVHVVQSIAALEADLSQRASSMVLIRDKDLKDVLSFASPAAFMRVRLQETGKAGFWLLDYTSFEYPISEMERWERTLDMGAANFERIYGLRPHTKGNGISLDLLRGPKAAFLFPAHRFLPERGAVLRILAGNPGRQSCPMRVILNGNQVGLLDLAPGVQSWVDFRVRPKAVQLGKNLLQIESLAPESGNFPSCSYDFNWLKVRPQH